MIELVIKFSPINRELIHSLLHELGIGAFVEGIPGTDLAHVDSSLTCYPQSAVHERSIREAVTTAAGTDPCLEFVSAERDDEDWAVSWKSQWKPVQISEKLWVAPSWSEFITPPGAATIWLDTTSAFGTGSHETTRLCLRLITEMLDPARHGSFLDIGCGSGVLAICARMAGIKQVHGIDIDPLAIETSINNAARNGCSDIIFTTGRSEQADCSADFVAANLLSGIIRQSWPVIHRNVRPNGSLVLSGILTEELADLITDLRINPLQVLTEGEWCAVLVRPDRGARPG